MNSTLRRAGITKNCNENENEAIFLFKLGVLNAIKRIRNKKNMLTKGPYLAILLSLIASKI